ncbi:MAG: hypothetical protein ACI39F_06915 [Acutalibacteraceae bacterium]
MVIKIINDTDLDVTYDILIDNKLHLHKTKHQAQSYEIYHLKQNQNNVRIFKDNIWFNNDKYSSFLNFLYIFDLEFGSLSDTNNLPYSIDYQKSQLSCDQEVYLSKIINIDKQSLDKWCKSSKIQIIFLVFLILIIGIVLSFLFKNFFKWLFILIVAVAAYFLNHLLNIRKKELIEKLLNIKTNAT